MINATMILLKSITMISSASSLRPTGDGEDLTEAFEDYDGVMVNSDQWTGLHLKEARPKMADYMEEKGIGKKSCQL